MWRQSGPSEQMLMMATYAPDPSSDTAEQMMDQWKLKKPKVEKNVIDQDGWIKSSTKKAGKGIMKAATAVGDDEEDEEDEEVDYGISFDPEILNERATRDFSMTQDDFDVEFDAKHFQRKSDEELADSWIQRSVEIPVNQKLLDLFKSCSKRSLDSLTVKEKSNLVKGWTAMLKMDAAANLRRLTAEYDAAADIARKYEADMDAIALRTADVIGMTTNGAAKYNRYGFVCTYFFAD